MIKILEKSDVLPVSLADVKNTLLVDHDKDDALITRLINQATVECENFTGKTLLTTRYRLNSHWNQHDVFNRIPRGPIQSVESFVTETYDGVRTIIDPVIFTYTDHDHSSFVRTISPDTWVSNWHTDYEIEYTAGYGAASTDIPFDLRGSLISYVVHLYQNLEGDSKRPNNVVRIWNSYRPQVL